jgi:hypothetical protein
MSKQIQYQEAIVTFIDILGFKNILSNSTENEIYEILQLFHSQYNKNNLTNSNILGRTYFSDIHFFSDSVVRVKYTDYEDMYLNAATDEVISLAVIQLELLKRNIYIRGGCTKGMIYSDSSSNILYGPALIDAYNIESNISLYPRIVISEGVWSDYFRDMTSTRHWVKKDSIANRGFDFMEVAKIKYNTTGWKNDAKLLGLEYNTLMEDQWFINYLWGPVSGNIINLLSAKNYKLQVNIKIYENEVEELVRFNLSLLEKYDRLISNEDIEKKIKIKYLWVRYHLHETIKDTYEWIIGYNLSSIINQILLKRLAEQSELFFKKYSLV